MPAVKERTRTIVRPEALRALRQRVRISSEQMAARMGLSQTALCGRERGERQFIPEEIDAYLGAIQAAELGRVERLFPWKQQNAVTWQAEAGGTAWTIKRNSKSGRYRLTEGDQVHGEFRDRAQAMAAAEGLLLRRE